ncbi:MAG: acyl-CoA thioesterase [Janthinobacterium lividum]
MDAQPTGQLTIRIVAMPADTNSSGDIFGGWIMAQMDLSAGVAGRERARGRVVTASVSSLSFLQPVKIGDVVAVYTEVVGTGRSSIRIQIEAWVVRGAGSAQLKVTEALFVMVAVDESGASVALPPA